VDPVFLYLIGGLIAGVVGSFIAARLLTVDRLWALPDKPAPRSFLASLTTAAKVYTVTGPSGLVNLVGATEHPLLSYALKLVIHGTSPQEIRQRVSDRLDALHAVDRRCQFAGRLLSQLSPVLGITGMAGAMYLALSRLNDPTGSAAGLAVCVLLLMVGGNLIAIFGRRLSKVTPQSTGAGQVTGTMIIEATAMIRSGATPQAVEARLLAILGDEPAAPAIAKAA
jgi:chemotaxis protein MotA